MSSVRLLAFACTVHRAKEEAARKQAAKEKKAAAKQKQEVRDVVGSALPFL